MEFFKKVGSFFSSLFGSVFGGKAGKELAVKLAVSELIERTSVTAAEVLMAAEAAAHYANNPTTTATLFNLLAVFNGQLPRPDLTPSERVFLDALLQAIIQQAGVEKSGDVVDAGTFSEVMGWVSEAASAAGE